MTQCVFDVVRDLMLHESNESTSIRDVSCTQVGHQMSLLWCLLTSGRTFRCSYDSVKSSFFRAYNAIYNKVGGIASVETILALLRAK